MISPNFGGHLGTRVSALLDGQLPQAEEEKAWEHVHACHFCRDLVEREGWVKTRLSTLTFGGGRAPDRLKDALMGAQAGLTPGDALLALSTKPAAAAWSPSAAARPAPRCSACWRSAPPRPTRRPSTAGRRAAARPGRPWSAPPACRAAGWRTSRRRWPVGAADPIR